MADNKTTGTNVKEMILNGATAEELLNSLRDEIKEAEKQIAAEKEEQEKKQKEREAREKNVNEARAKLIDATVAYLDALNEDNNFVDTKDNRKDIENIIKSMEKEYLNQIKLINSLTKFKNSIHKKIDADGDKKVSPKSNYNRKLPIIMDDIDDIISDFLRTL